MGALKSLRIRFDKEARADLQRALFDELEHCGPSRRSRLSDWWFDNGPRVPKWDVSVYAQELDAETGSSEEYKFLFTLYQLSYLETKRAVKYLGCTDRPMKVVREFCWD